LRLFKEVKGYATEQNAIKKLMNALKCENEQQMDSYVIWSMGTTKGRFYPVVHGFKDSEDEHYRKMALAQDGVCVTGW
jgi:hypothetical protein